MRLIKGLIVIAISIVVVVFAISNRDLVPVHFFFNNSEIEMPLFVLIFVSLIVGILLCSLATLIYKAKVHHELREKKNRIKALENELASLKTENRIADTLPVESKWQ